MKHGSQLLIFYAIINNNLREGMHDGWKFQECFDPFAPI